VGPEPPSWSTPAPPRHAFLVLFVLFLGTTTASALWHPLYSAPDEPTHVIRAAAVARGQVRYAETTPVAGLESSVVRVPRVFADSIHTPQCYIFRAGIPASCATLPTGGEEVQGLTYAGRYPPLYYLAVGLPTLAWESNRAVYAMRIVNAAICSVFLAQAIVIALGLRRRLLPLGIASAVTPMVLYLAGVVNPNGPEIAAAICLWTALAAVGVTRNLSWRGPLLWVALSGVALASTRPSGPLWVGTAVAVTVVSGLLSPVRPLLRSRPVRAAAAAVGVASSFTIGWVASLGGVGLTGAPLDDPERAWILSLGMTGQRLRHMVGFYGWLDAPAPGSVYLAWGVVAAGIVALGLLASPSRRHALAIALLVVAVVVVAIPFEVLEAKRIGLFWQGRYTLPIAVGVPILATVAPTDRLGALAASWVRAATGLVLASAHLAAVVWGIRRFAVGITGPVMFFSDAAWTPPLPHWLLAAVFTAGVAAIGAYLARSGAGPPWPHRRPGGAAAGDGPAPLVPGELTPAERR